MTRSCRLKSAAPGLTRPPTTPKPPPKRAVAGQAVQWRVFAITHQPQTARNRANPSHAPASGVPRRPLWRGVLGLVGRGPDIEVKSPARPVQAVRRPHIIGLTAPAGIPALC